MGRAKVQVFEFRLIIVFIDESGSIKYRTINQYPRSLNGLLIQAHHAMSPSHAQASMAQVPSGWRPHCFTRATSFLAADFNAGTEAAEGPAVALVSFSATCTGSSLAVNSLKLSGNNGPVTPTPLPLPGPPPEFIRTSGPRSEERRVGKGCRSRCSR